MNILTEILYNDQRIWQITRFNLIYMTVWYYTLCGFELHNILGWGECAAHHCGRF